jgi:hypothetical protein
LPEVDDAHPALTEDLYDFVRSYALAEDVVRASGTRSRNAVEPTGIARKRRPRAPVGGEQLFDRGAHDRIVRAGRVERAMPLGRRERYQLEAELLHALVLSGRHGGGDRKFNRSAASPPYALQSTSMPVGSA